MKLKVEVNKIDWWFWAITLVLIISALLGWLPGYYLVMSISAVHVIYFYGRYRSLMAFDTQVRIAYFGLTLLGLIQLIRFPLYILLFLGTLMVVFFDRCGIALALKYMPWNKQPISTIQRKAE